MESIQTLYYDGTTVVFCANPDRENYHPSLGECRAGPPYPYIMCYSAPPNYKNSGPKTNSLLLDNTKYDIGANHILA